MYRSESLSESVMTYTGSVLALQPWWRDGWITKSCKEVLGVGGNVCYLDCSLSCFPGWSQGQRGGVLEQPSSVGERQF